MENIEKLWISCKDGYQLAAQLYTPSQISKTYPILICPATGITQSFYHAFASWLSQQGYVVMIFDFRGIGQSLHGRLSQSSASIVDWGTLDIPAAITTLLSRTHAEKVILLGHSAGGQLLGINPLYHQVHRVIAVAGSTGHIKGLKGKTKLLAPVMFNLVFPASSLIKGYGATQFIGMGENLPKLVAKQWRQFCSQPGYIKNAIGKTVHHDFHTQIVCPVTSIWATDDEIATEINVKDLLRLYPNAPTKMIELNPKSFGFKSIGHMLMFKKSHQTLWPLIQQQIES
ncbi:MULTISPECIES: alpha/beta fold hydrolase [unclassified Acinetobacter]|uniref:alpha/beta hydrolase family protein n=1 Tax=unclassified Acinetobacter TaxID=196816 RepID=UPI00190B3585|nr:MULTISPECIES: alpha/beta fold hydrolase [unclassified Acinetobacter]MBK0062047.1 alpha/beta fold hydrolase [Acinetobacter sp. S55]MBK0065851.1 alpha/beta fold hydrolase [Acinetobacter sp. S54]